MSDDNSTLYDQAVELALARGKITAKVIRQELHLNQAQAQKLVDEMEAKGVVGPHRGRWEREVLRTREQLSASRGTEGNGAEVAPSPAANGGVLSLLLAGGTTTDEPFDRALVVLGLAALKSRIREVEQQLLRPR